MGRREAKPFDAEEATDPFALLHRWMSEAAATEPNDPDAAALATATPHGTPSVRMVLIKQVTPEGLAFYTNSESQKGWELAGNPSAALCFHWKTQRRQVRVEGRTRETSSADADRYFHSRARRSQIGALVSAQSRPLAGRDVLMKAALEMEERVPGEVPRPAYWRGYLIDPQRIEFWQDGEFRLHDRIVFVRNGAGWDKIRLYP